MIKSFSSQVVLGLLSSKPYLLMLAKTDYPSIVYIERKNNVSHENLWQEIYQTSRHDYSKHRHILVWRNACMFKIQSL